MSDLNKFRAEISEIDRMIYEVLGKRFSITRQIGKLKKQAGLPVQDHDREKEILQKVEKHCSTYGVNRDLGTKIMNAIIEEVVKEHKKA